MRGPTKEELVKAVSGWLSGEPTPADGFHRKVAANAMGIVERELALWPACEAGAIARMSAILGETGDYDSLNEALASAIRNGVVNASDPKVFEHLKQTALDMLAVDQPRYRHSLSGAEQ
ncbi:DUF6285 domain-containing protein [Brevundimonas sp.]|uniref:DUF6285 domain-containing protein n=1 Tax=Brevundimonas sp. TaxID=1871086 RepID=UPI002FCB9ABB